MSIMQNKPKSLERNLDWIRISAITPWQLIKFLISLGIDIDNVDMEFDDVDVGEFVEAQKMPWDGMS